MIQKHFHTVVLTFSSEIVNIMKLTFERKNPAFEKKKLSPDPEQAGLRHATLTALTRPFTIDENTLMSVAPFARAIPQSYPLGPEQFP